MRIALIMVSKGYGGLERHVVELANALAEYHTVRVFADESFAERLVPNIVLIPLRADAWRFNPWTLWRLRRQINTFAPDVIHAQANKAAWMVWLSGAQARARIATIHNLKNDTRPFGAFDGVIAVSLAVGQRLKHPRLTVIPNGIAPPLHPDPATVAEWRDRWCPNNEPMTISVGRLVPAKGFDILLEAWQNLPGRLVIIGSGPDEAALKAQHDALGLGDRVLFAGYSPDIPLFMASADVLVIASRREGFPYVLIEALHMGIPIISTAIPGAADYLPTEAVVPCGEPKLLHAAIENALKNASILRSQYRPWFERAQSELTLEHMVQLTVDFYTQVLNKPTLTR